MMNRPDYDVIVVGGGVVGLAFASAMRQSGRRILVLESGEFPPRPDETFDIRVNSINLASQAFLESLGVWDAVIALRAAPFREIRVWDSGGSRVEFCADDIDEDELGHIVENSVLITSLLESFGNASGVDLRTGARLGAVVDGVDHVQVRLERKETVSCYLLVGADGGNSMVREMAGIEIAQQKGYGQRAIVAQVRASESTVGISYQKFLPTGPLAFLPLSDGSFSIVWSCVVERAEELEGMSDEAFEQELAQALDYRLGEMRLLSRRVSFELKKLRTAAYFRGRTVLIGDSAHVIHPLAGMGANLGLMDAAALFEVLSAVSGEGKDPWSHSQLRKYERWRKSVNSPVISLMDGFDWGFRAASEKRQSLLGLGFSLTNHTRPVKANIMRFACGITGDLPDCARRA